MAEYALGIALVAVASIGAIETLTDRSSDELNDRGSSIGAPDLGATGDPAPPPPPPPDPGDPTPPSTPESVVTVTLTGGTTRSGQLWSASVTALALDDLGRPREAVGIIATWTSTAPGFTAQDTQCSTNLNGTCTMTIRNLDQGSVPNVTLTVTSIFGDGITANPAPAPLVLTAP